MGAKQALIESVAGLRLVPDDVKEKVHEVREYRNSLVHEIDDEVISIGLGEARGRLCTFFARLPEEW